MSTFNHHRSLLKKEGPLTIRIAITASSQQRRRREGNPRLGLDKQGVVQGVEEKGFWGLGDQGVNPRMSHDASGRMLLRIFSDLARGSALGFRLVVKLLNDMAGHKTMQPNDVPLTSRTEPKQNALAHKATAKLSLLCQGSMLGKPALLLFAK